jgi:hypothetical protein
VAVVGILLEHGLNAAHVARLRVPGLRSTSAMADGKERLKPTLCLIICWICGLSNRYFRCCPGWGLVTVLLNCGFLARYFTRLRFLDSLSLTHFAVWV